MCRDVTALQMVRCNTNKALHHASAATEIKSMDYKPLEPPGEDVGDLVPTGGHGGGHVGHHLLPWGGRVMVVMDGWTAG